MRKFAFLFLFLLLGGLSWGQNYEWAKGFGDGTTMSFVRSIDVDADGNVYATGIFYGTVDFDPGPGVFPLIGSIDTINSFIVKLNVTGNLVWAKAIKKGPQSFGIATDSLGNVYVSGGFPYTTDFDPGPGIFNLATPGANNGFVLKLDSSGNFVWAKKFGNAPQITAYSITCDPSGDILFTGVLQGTVDFDPGPSVFNLTGSSSGQIFVAKLNASGNFMWAVQLSNGGSAGMDIATDVSGNVYTTGHFQQSSDFDPGPGVFNLIPSAIGNEVFISKLSGSGNFIWAKSIGGSDQDRGNAITVDLYNNIYTTGNFRATADFDPGPAIFNLISMGQDDAFICKMDAAGNFAWAKSIGGADNDAGSAVAVDSMQNVYATGYFRNTVDFDPGPGVYHLTAPATYNIIYLTKLDVSGDLIWAESVGARIAPGIDLGPQNSIYAGGAYMNAVDFDPGPDTALLSGTSGQIGYILKLWQCNVSTSVLFQTNNMCYGAANGSVTVNIEHGTPPYTYTWSNGSTTSTASGLLAGTYTCTITDDSGCVKNQTVTITEPADIQFSQTVNLCNGYSFAVGTNTYDSSGTYTDVLTSYHGCDSTVTTTLTIDPAIVNVQTINLCSGESITIGPNTYTTPGTYIDTLTAVNGCDSTVTTELSIKAPILTALHLSICDGESITVGSSTYSTPGTYTDVLTAVDGCDSTIVTTLGVKPAITSSQTLAICNGESVTVGTSTYNVSGTYIDTLMAANGCDSTVTTNLTVNTIDITTSSSLPSITANQSGAAYQWLNCNNGFSPIVGETAQTYTATANGNYAAAITLSGCSDTTACVNITGLNVDAASQTGEVKVFPNPATNSITVSTGVVPERIALFDLAGRNVMSMQPSNTSTSIKLTHLQNGIYFVKVRAGQTESVVKVVKQ